MDGMAWIGICQLHPKNPTEGVEIFLFSVSLRIPEGYGINQHPQLDTLLFQWGY